ncbi:hypothetical protein P692DRAFT_20877656 [Suillus brevipes Sb2]|nr:hypothetical protein P692DRAFT_20877656 [Suillus brevipes Sb2]
MTGTVLTDGEDEPRVVRPVRKIKPTAALLQHSEKAALPSQTKAINDFRAAEAAKRASEVSRPAALTAPVPATQLAPPPSNKRVRPDDAPDAYCTTIYNVALIAIEPRLRLAQAVAFGRLRLMALA